MQLEAGKQYSITPNTSKLSYIMLDKLLTWYYSIRVSRLADSKGADTNVSDLDPNQIDYSPPLIGFIAKKISWWFSRLLCLDDNDLRVYKGFYFVEVLYLCDKLFDLYEQTPEDIARFKELLPAIKEYVHARLPMYK